MSCASCAILIPSKGKPCHRHALPAQPIQLDAAGDPTDARLLAILDLGYPKHKTHQKTRLPDPPLGYAFSCSCIAKFRITIARAFMGPP